MFPVFRAFFSVRKGFEDLMDKGLEGRLGYRVKPAEPSAAAGGAR